MTQIQHTQTEIDTLPTTPNNALACFKNSIEDDKDNANFCLYQSKLVCLSICFVANPIPHTYLSNFVQNLNHTSIFFMRLYIQKMLCVLLIFFQCFPNCDVTFKITNKLKVNNSNLKFNGNFKSHIIIKRILEEYLAFIYIYIYILFFKKKKKEETTTRVYCQLLEQMQKLM